VLDCANVSDIHHAKKTSVMSGVSKETTTQDLWGSTLKMTTQGPLDKTLETKMGKGKGKCTTDMINESKFEEKQSDYTSKYTEMNTSQISKIDLTADFKTKENLFSANKFLPPYDETEGSRIGESEDSARDSKTYEQSHPKSMIQDLNGPFFSINLNFK